MTEPKNSPVVSAAIRSVIDDLRKMPRDELLREITRDFHKNAPWMPAVHGILKETGDEITAVKVMGCMHKFLGRKS